MKIIIAGGTGLIGAYISDRLANDGNEIVILTRSGKNDVQKKNGSIKFQSWDGSTLSGWVDAIQGAEAVINLSGENISAKRWTSQRKKEIIDSRVNSGRALSAAIQKVEAKPGLFIQASAVGYYGIHQDEILDESSRPGEDFLSKVCVEWENSSTAVEKMGVRHVVIRLGVVLSRDGGALPKMVLPFNLFIGGAIGNGNQYISWIHPADVYHAIKFIMDHDDVSGAVNLTAPGAVTNREFSKIIASVLHRPSYLPVPAFAMKLLFGEMATVLLDGQRAYPKKLLDKGFKFQYADAQSALSDLLGSK
jgi:hypothetical protein